MTKIAYLMNTYPMTSTTFVRREIEAHERAGVPITRFAIRQWHQELVDPDDIAEVGKVTYLLDGGAARLGQSFLAELFANPVGFLGALKTTFGLAANLHAKRLRAFAYFLEAVRCKREASACGVTHIHAHFSTNSAAVALLVRRLGGPSYSFTVHGPDELFDMQNNSLRLKMQHAAFVVAITEYCRTVIEEFSDHRYSDKIAIVRCGLDLDAFPHPTAVPSNHRMVCVGRLCKQKAQILLVEACAQIRDVYPDLQLVLIGDGDQRSEIEQRIRDLGLESMIDLAGWKGNREVLHELKLSRALLLPSLAEGLPIVLMESLAMGRPVLSTRIAGIPELVDESCGWLAHPGSVDSLVSELKSMLATDPSELTAKGLSGRERVLQLHDQAKNAERLRELINGYSD